MASVKIFQIGGRVYISDYTGRYLTKSKKWAMYNSSDDNFCFPSILKAEKFIESVDCGVNQINNFYIVFKFIRDRNNYNTVYLSKEFTWEDEILTSCVFPTISEAQVFMEQSLFINKIVVDLEL